MAVITIAVCDEVRKDAQKLVKKLSELIPEAEILVYRNRESLLNGLKDEHKRCDVLFMGLDGEKGENLETVRAIRLGGNYVPVVLVAANDHFYKEAFEVFAFNYITKPVGIGELEHVMKPILTPASWTAERHFTFSTGRRSILCSTGAWFTYQAVCIMWFFTSQTVQLSAAGQGLLIFPISWQTEFSSMPSEFSDQSG